MSDFSADEVRLACLKARLRFHEVNSPRPWRVPLEKLHPDDFAAMRRLSHPVEDLVRMRMCLSSLVEFESDELLKDAARAGPRLRLAIEFLRFAAGRLEELESLVAEQGEWIDKRQRATPH